MTEHELIADYRHRLHLAAADMPADESTELLADIEEHLHEIQKRHADDEIGLRSALDRLGAPSEVVAAARADEPSAAPAATITIPAIPMPRRRDELGFALGALLLPIVGELLFVFGIGVLFWLAGMVMLFLSSRFTSTERWVGIPVLGLGLFAMPFVLFAGLTSKASSSVSGTVCTDDSFGGGLGSCVDGPELPGASTLGTVGLVLFVTILVVQTIYVATMLWRLRQRSAGAATAV